MHRIAFYDLDKTITRRASFGPFIGHVIKKYRRSRIAVVPLMAILTLLYGAGLISRARLKERNLELLAGEYPGEPDLRDMAASFARETIDSNILQPALAQMAADRQAGYRIVIASASFHFYVSAIGKLLDVTDIIATDLRMDSGGHYQSRISGENCYGPQKLVMVQDWMKRERLDRAQCHIRFYSDHVSDAPCLIWADEAFATNADALLKAMAQAKGWICLNWLSES